MLLYPQLCKAEELGVALAPFPALVGLREALRQLPAFATTGPDSV